MPSVSAKPARLKPKKPHPDFPLFPHATGRWAKKIGGRFAFFGPWEDPFGALDRYNAQRDAIIAERLGPPRRAGQVAGRAGAGAPRLNGASARDAATGGDVGHANGDVAASGSTSGAAVVTVRDLVNHFLTAKKRQVDSGELGRRAFGDYHAVCGRLVSSLGPHRRVDGLTSADFGMLRADRAKRYGPVALGIEIGRIRTVFKFGVDAGQLERAVNFGPEFVKPRKLAMRQARRAAGSKLLTPGEVKRLLDAAGVQMRAMILLGLNCGMGNTDVASLPRSALDLKKGMLDFPRPKTGVARRAALWPETVEALKAVLKVRPDAAEPADGHLAFLTKYGRPWVRVQDAGKRSKGKRPFVITDAVSLEFRKLTKELGLERPRLGFYALRHTFRTVADEVADRRAVDLVMGHENGADIANHYVEQIDDCRLKQVANHIRAWLGFPR